MNPFSSSFSELENLGKRHYLQSEAPTSQYLNTMNPEKKMAVASEERIYAQVGTLDPTSHQLQHQPNQIFYNAQFDIDTMGKVPRKQIQPGQSNVYYLPFKKSLLYIKE